MAFLRFVLLPRVAQVPFESSAQLQGLPPVQSFFLQTPKCDHLTRPSRPQFFATIAVELASRAQTKPYFEFPLRNSNHGCLLLPQLLPQPLYGKKHVPSHIHFPTASSEARPL